MPVPGQSFVGALPVPQRHGMSLVVRLLGTRPTEKALRSGLLGGVDPARADRLVAELTPAPKALFLDRTPPGSAVVGATYVLTTRDSEFPADLQETYAARLGGDVIQLDTGHLPMLEAPGALAQVLCDRLAASRGS